MKKYNRIAALLVLGMIMISASASLAQNANEFTIPLTDPAKRGKLKAHLNSGSITVKGERTSL
jgi:hypothetical protein